MFELIITIIILMLIGAGLGVSILAWFLWPDITTTDTTKPAAEDRSGHLVHHGNLIHHEELL